MKTKISRFKIKVPNDRQVQVWMCDNTDVHPDKTTYSLLFEIRKEQVPDLVNILTESSL